MTWPLTLVSSSCRKYPLKSSSCGCCRASVITTSEWFYSNWLGRVFFFKVVQGFYVSVCLAYTHDVSRMPWRKCLDLAARTAALLPSAEIFCLSMSAGTNTSCWTARSWTNWVPYPWRPTSPRWKLWSTLTGAWCVTGRRVCWHGSSLSWRGSPRTRPSGQSGARLSPEQGWESLDLDLRASVSRVSHLKQSSTTLQCSTRWVKKKYLGPFWTKIKSIFK